MQNSDGTALTGTFTTALAEFDWSLAPGAKPEVTAVRFWGPDGWEPCSEKMKSLLSDDPVFIADLRLLIGPVTAPDPEPDPCP